MIKARAARRFNLDGKAYAKGDPIDLPANQFDDLKGCGLVEPDGELTAELAAAGKVISGIRDELQVAPPKERPAPKPKAARKRA